MKILIQADCLDDQNAGVYHYTKNIISELIHSYPENDYTLIRYKKDKKLLLTNQVCIPDLPIILWKSIRLFLILPFIILKQKPDVFWTPTHIFPPFLPKKTLKIVTIHDLTSITHPKFHTFMNKLGHKLFLGPTLKKADLIVCVSRTVTEEVRQKYNPKAQIATIYNGIEETPKTSKTPPIKDPYILYLGTMEPRKNLELLIKTFLKTNVPHKLVLIGDFGWKSEKIHQLIDKHTDRIIYKGYLPTETKNNFLAHTTCLIYPSIYEGFGLPPLEAMQLGVPVITSTGGALKELYTNVTLCFEPDDSETLQKHIVDFCTNQTSRQKYSKLGLEFSKNFSWEKSANELAKLFVTN